MMDSLLNVLENPMTRGTCFALAASTAASTALAAVIDVPGDFAQIQAAITKPAPRCLVGEARPSSNRKASSPAVGSLTMAPVRPVAAFHSATQKRSC